MDSKAAAKVRAFSSRRFFSRESQAPVEGPVIVCSWSIQFGILRILVPHSIIQDGKAILKSVKVTDDEQGGLLEHKCVTVVLHASYGSLDDPTGLIDAPTVLPPEAVVRQRVSGGNPDDPTGLDAEGRRIAMAARCTHLASADVGRVIEATAAEQGLEVEFSVGQHHLVAPKS
jgi:hypothetical protein